MLVVPGEAVDLLQDIERHFLLRIDQRHDLELERHFLELECWTQPRAGVVQHGAVGRRSSGELTGTGISVPEAMIAFLLLLVKTIGRETTLNLPVDSSRCTIVAR